MYSCTSALTRASLLYARDKFHVKDGYDELLDDSEDEDDDRDRRVKIRKVNLVEYMYTINSCLFATARSLPRHFILSGRDVQGFMSSEELRSPSWQNNESITRRGSRCSWS